MLFYLIRVSIPLSLSHLHTHVSIYVCAGNAVLFLTLHPVRVEGMGGNYPLLTENTLL